VFLAVSCDIFFPNNLMNITLLSYVRSPHISRLSRREIFFNKSGAGMIEYALIVALIMLVGIVGLSSLSQQGINSTLQTAKDGLESASS
jgi:Flp pilus assembly pilin Flp